MPLLVVVAFVSSARVRALICGAAAVVCAVIDPPGVIVSGEREIFFDRRVLVTWIRPRGRSSESDMSRVFCGAQCVCALCAREDWSFCKDG